MMVDKNAIVVFVKNAVEGKVKTRIGNVKGHHVAVDVYTKLLDIASKIVARVSATRIVYYGKHIEGSDYFTDQLFNKKLQEGEDLGVRMAHAFDQELSHFDKIVLIGSDCPDLTPQIIEHAFDALDESDLVLGPTYDGGYYLIACRKFDIMLFNDMVWSSEKVLDKTVENARKLGFKTHLLEKLGDIDYWEDWEAYVKGLN